MKIIIPLVKLLFYLTVALLVCTVCGLGAIELICKGIIDGRKRYKMYKFEQKYFKNRPSKFGTRN